MAQSNKETDIQATTQNTQRRAESAYMMLSDPSTAHASVRLMHKDNIELTASKPVHNHMSPILYLLLLQMRGNPAGSTSLLPLIASMTGMAGMPSSMET